MDDFFNCVCCLMTNHLWKMTENTLNTLKTFFVEFDQAKSWKSVFKINFDVSNNRVRFTPSATEIENDILGVVEDLIQSIQNIPRIETKLFTSLNDNSMSLIVMSIETAHQSHGQYIRNVLLQNLVGAHKHAISFENFKIFLSPTYEKKISDFLDSDHLLAEYDEEILKLKNYMQQVCDNPSKVWISMFYMDCEDLNRDLSVIIDSLVKRIIEYVADISRKTNAKYFFKKIPF